jgi:anaerobic C4-dicarboxylate transporter
MEIAIILELLVVMGAIVMGVRMGGMGLGIWGVVGVGVLVFVFGLAPGQPPISAMLIILAVITAAAWCASRPRSSARTPSRSPSSHRW